MLKFAGEMEQIIEDTPAEDRHIMRKRLLREYQKSLKGDANGGKTDRPITMTEEDVKLGLTEEQIAKQRQRNRSILHAMDRSIRGVKERSTVTTRSKNNHAVKLLAVLWSALVIGVLGFILKLLNSNAKVLPQSR